MTNNLFNEFVLNGIYQIKLLKGVRLEFGFVENE